MEDYVTTFTVQENKADTYADFYLAPAAPLLPGPYSLEILLDDRLSRAMDFTVQDEIAEGLPLVASATLTPTLLEITLQPAQASPVIDVSEAMIGRISFSTAVTDDHQAINPGTQFAQVRRRSMRHSLTRDSPLRASSRKCGILDGVETARGDSAWEREQSGHYEGSLNNEQGLLEGNYRLDIVLDGNVLGSGEFTIGETVEDRRHTGSNRPACSTDYSHRADRSASRSHHWAHQLLQRRSHGTTTHDSTHQLP